MLTHLVLRRICKPRVGCWPTTCVPVQRAAIMEASCTKPCMGVYDWWTRRCLLIMSKLTCSDPGILALPKLVLLQYYKTLSSITAVLKFFCWYKINYLLKICPSFSAKFLLSLNLCITDKLSLFSHVTVLSPHCYPCATSSIFLAIY